MPNLPCCVSTPCIDPANPLANFSAEKPDQEIFVGYNSGWDDNVPPIGHSWGTLGCVSFCESTVSQADADNCAALQQLICTVEGCDDCGNGGGGWKDPGGNPDKVFFNTAQHCDIVCPDGLPFRFSVAGGQFGGLSQAEADQCAQSVACLEGQAERMCMNEIQSVTCVNEFYFDVIDTDGGAPPIVFRIVAGSLPPGLTFAQTDAFSVDISGTPTVPGNYTFTVRAVDRFGLFMNKTYHISVLGITNSPPDASVGSAYSFQFTVTGGTAPYTFALASGSLPAGLSLSGSGAITGTPTTNGTQAFTVSVTDSST